MNDPLVGIAAASAALDRAWNGGGAGARPEPEELTAAQLIEVNRALGTLRRSIDAVHARVASQIARHSRPELGADALAKQHGYRNPSVLIAATTGTTNGEAARLVAVGEATTPRMTFSGHAAPARHPSVAAAIGSGQIGMPAAAAIIGMLDRVGVRVARATAEEVEQALCAQAVGLSLDQLAKVIARAEAHLDPDGLEPSEHELRRRRTVTLFERGGMLHLNAKLDPESAAPVKAAIEAIVTAEFRVQNRTVSTASDGTGDAPSGVADPDLERRTVTQRQADALVLLCQHALGCDSNDLPLDGVTVVVRMSLIDLQAGTGVVTIDGLTQPLSVSAARKLAASGGIIPCVLGADGEILDWGRRRRLFTRAQKLALVERDGGCAMCGLPPGMTKAHHLAWWERDTGPTDLRNGVLLCESCHHRIHDNGWQVRIDGDSTAGTVWFIPPPHVDPHRTARLGGRARYDYAA